MSHVMIITGTSKGIGKALALHYLSAGCIVAGCSRSESSITHEHYEHFILDVCDESSVVSMVSSVLKQHKFINVLINNAGIASMNAFLLTPLSSARAIFETNVLGGFLFCREVGKVMIRQKYGRIVNLSTVASPLRLEGEALYASSKAAIEKMTEILARELGHAGITVNAVGPTPVDTDLISRVSQNKINALIKRQSIPRKGTLEDVIHAVDFFINPRSDFITGQVLYLGGVHG
jgi:3-oxoacyl-[acyl-carrier protein] reductase